MLRIIANLTGNYADTYINMIDVESEHYCLKTLGWDFDTNEGELVEDIGELKVEGYEEYKERDRVIYWSRDEKRLVFVEVITFVDFAKGYARHAKLLYWNGRWFEPVEWERFDYQLVGNYLIDDLPIMIWEGKNNVESGWKYLVDISDARILSTYHNIQLTDHRLVLGDSFGGFCRGNYWIKKSTDNQWCGIWPKAR